MSIFKEPVRDEIKEQLKRRQEAMASDPRTPQQLTWLNSRNSWIRMASSVNVNGTPDLAKAYILQGGTLTGFGGTLKSGVGTNFTNNAYANSDLAGTPYRHGLRPMPGITGIEVKSKGAYGSLREAVVSFQCWDILQLEDLELLYMRPGYSVLVEWGWSPYLNNSKNLITTINPIDDVLLGTGTKEDIWKKIFDRYKTTNGNYDAVYGIVKNYSWKARTDGGYDCTTTLITIGEVLESLKINYAASDSSIPQEGVFKNDLFSKVGVVTPFQPQSFYSKAHQQNIIAGIAVELWAIGASGFDRSGVLLLDNKDSRYIDLNGGNAGRGIDVALARFDVTATGRAANLENTIFDSDKNIYIQLNSFIEILNKYVLVEDAKHNRPYASISLREGEHMEHPGRPLLCVGNRYQISTNPLVGLICNQNYRTPSNLGFSSTCSTIPSLMLHLNTGMYDSTQFRFIESYFYDGPRNSDEYGVIGNIYINLAYIYSLVVDEELENTDKKEKKDINLFDFLKSLMKGVNAVIGNLANFEIFVDPQDSVIRIIDINYVNPEPASNVINKAPIIELQNLNSITRNYSFESQIFPEQSTIVAIGAQAEGGALGENVKTLIDFNRSLTDRIIPRKEAPSSKGTDATTKQTNLKENFKILSAYFCELAPDWWEGVGDFDADEASSYENALKDIINYVLENPNLGGLNNKAIIPTKLSIEIDGIGGFIIGNIFRINEDIVPRGYRGLNGVGAQIGYVVTGINHSIKDGDWATKVDSQFIILEDPLGTKNLTATARVTPPAFNGGGPLLLASANIGINSQVFLGSVKVNYLLSIDQASTKEVKVNFTHTLTKKDGSQLSQEVNGTIPAGKTSAVVSVEFSENLEDLLTDPNAATFANISSTENNSNVTSDTSYTFGEGANKILSPVSTKEAPEQKPCPSFPTDAKTVVDITIQALNKLGYPHFTEPWYLNVVGIRNTDKDFGKPSEKVDPTGAIPTNTTTPERSISSPTPPLLDLARRMGQFNRLPSDNTFFRQPPPPLFDPIFRSKLGSASVQKGPIFGSKLGSASVQKGFLGNNVKGKPIVNTFTDWLVCWYYDDKNKRIDHFGKATTVAGKRYQSVKFYEVPGATISLGRNLTLLEGHYVDFYEVGRHNKQENCLVNNESYTSLSPIYRIDRGLDSVYSFDGYWEGEIINPKNPKQLISAKQNNPYITSRGNGLLPPSTNIHHSNEYQSDDPKKDINNWSAGCQVWRSYKAWEIFSKAAVQQTKKTSKKLFSYSLLNVRDLPGFENCQDPVNP